MSNFKTHFIISRCLYNKLKWRAGVGGVGRSTLENRPLTKKAYSGTNKLPVWVRSDTLETPAKWLAESKHGDDKKFRMLK